jgi:hypothetical protein
MSTRFHRRIKTNSGGHLNFSKSGVSHSQKVGVYTFNSRGTVSYNSSIKGLSFRMKTPVWFLFAPLRLFAKAVLWMIKLPFALLGNLSGKKNEA